MRRFQFYINTAITLIETFKGEKPFAVFLKQFFAANKKCGVQDRRFITSLCYDYFRIGFAGAGIAPDQKMLIAFFLCETSPSVLMEKLQPEWDQKMGWAIQDKLSFIQPSFSLTDIFPFINELSDGIEAPEFCGSFLVQPDLFLRLRPLTKITVLKNLRNLRKSKLSWQLEGEDCIRLAASEKVEDFFIIDKEVVVQDYNSQKVLDYLKAPGLQMNSMEGRSPLSLSVWDCCAASGGKSILLNDILKRKIDLTVSDVRLPVILNLHQRFIKAGIREYKYFIEDITNASFKPAEHGFGLIICDAPCSGSGTWGRTPEQLYFFKQPSIDGYSSLQKKIVANALPHLQPGGLFVYITCSVFKKENETIAAYIAENFNCALLHQQLLKGYDKKADTMFVAVFRKGAGESLS